jgi:salicylate hydroxylase
MTPFQASGAGQAIEDAWVLANVLAKALSSVPSDSTARLAQVGKALRIYDQVRRSIAIEVQDRSRRSGRIVTMADTAPDESPESIKRKIRDVWSWGELIYFLFHCYCQLKSLLKLGSVYRLSKLKRHWKCLR